MHSSCPSAPISLYSLIYPIFPKIILYRDFCCLPKALLRAGAGRAGTQKSRGGLCVPVLLLMDFSHGFLWLPWCIRRFLFLFCKALWLLDWWDFLSHFYRPLMKKFYRFLPPLLIIIRYLQKGNYVCVYNIFYNNPNPKQSNLKAVII